MIFFLVFDGARIQSPMLPPNIDNCRGASVQSRGLDHGQSRLAADQMEAISTWAFLSGAPMVPYWPRPMRLFGNRRPTSSLPSSNVRPAPKARQASNCW